MIRLAIFIRFIFHGSIINASLSSSDAFTPKPIITRQNKIHQSLNVKTSTAGKGRKKPAGGPSDGLSFDPSGTSNTCNSAVSNEKIVPQIVSSPYNEKKKTNLQQTIIKRNKQDLIKKN